MAFLILIKRALALGLICNLLTSCAFWSEQEPKWPVVGVADEANYHVAQTIRSYLLRRNLMTVDVQKYPNSALLMQDLAKGSIDLAIAVGGDISVVRYPEVVSLGRGFLCPTAAYSHTLTDLKDLEDGAVIAIADASYEQARALKLLEQAGLFRLGSGQQALATIADIQLNRKRVTFMQDSPEMMPVYLNHPDVSLAIVNCEVALSIGLNPRLDSVVVEDKNSLYVPQFFTRNGLRNSRSLQLFINTYHKYGIVNQRLVRYWDVLVQGW